MKKLVIATAAFLLSFSGFAQNENLDYDFALKANIRGVYKFHHYSQGFKPGESSLTDKMIQPGISLEWQSKQLNSHETYFNFSKNNFPRTLHIQAKHTYYSGGYNYFLNFNKNKNTKVIPSVGAGLNLFSEDFKAAYYRGGRSELDLVGAKAVLIPRLLLLPGSRIMIEVSLPIALANVNYGDSLEETEGQITSNQNDVSAEIFPKHFGLQVGIGIKL